MATTERRGAIPPALEAAPSLLARADAFHHRAQLSCLCLQPDELRGYRQFVPLTLDHRMLGRAARKASMLRLCRSFYILGTMESTEAIEALSALASEARLAVFRLLVKRGPAGYTPSELIARLGIPAPTLSFHLKGLLHADLVVIRREGRNLYYSPNMEHMNTLVSFLTDNCCSLADEACDAHCQPASAPSSRKRA